MLSKYLILLSAMFFSNIPAAEAQEQTDCPREYCNTVKLATASVHIPRETGDFRPFSQVGGFYERRILGNWSAGIGYMQWLTVNNGRGYESPKEDVLAFKGYYKMADVYGLHRQRLGKVHGLSAGLGVTYTVGVNYYYHEVRTWMAGDNLIPTGKSESFWGMVSQVSYSYRFLRGRAQIGADFRVRHYFNEIRPQYELGAHIGFMF